MRSDNGEMRTVIGQQITEAEAYLESMESRGFYSGGPPDIEGVYDSRVYLLKESLKFVLGLLESATPDERQCAQCGKPVADCDLAVFMDGEADA